MGSIYTTPIRNAIKYQLPMIQILILFFLATQNDIHEGSKGRCEIGSISQGQPCYISFATFMYFEVYISYEIFKGEQFLIYAAFSRLHSSHHPKVGHYLPRIYQWCG